MITLFDQGYAVDAYAKELAREQAKKAKQEGIEEGIEQGIEQGREEGIRVTVEIYREIGLDFSGTVDKLSSKYGLSRGKAAEYVEKYWQDAE